MRYACFAAVILTAICISPRTSADDSLPVTIRHQPEDQRVDVMLGDDLFTTFDYGTYDKPILYPVYGPGQVGMTRNWPMKEGVDGEAHDHPHHKSMWIAHEISGVDFWAEKGGRVITDGVETDFSGESNQGNALRASASWIKNSDGKTLLTSQTTFWFGGTKHSRWIDCLVEFRATHGDIQFDDTKEGLFAIRTHPDLRLKAAPKHGVIEVYGTAMNSEGVSGKDIWGKTARWVLYRGPIDGTPMSIAMFDHPTNPRHPTAWHARDYGLVTANPFGLHYFQGKEKGAGAFPIKSGDSLALRYRIEFFAGEASSDKVERSFQSFAAKARSAVDAAKPLPTLDKTRATSLSCLLPEE